MPATLHPKKKLNYHLHKVLDSAVAIAEHDCHLNRSLFDVLRVLRGSLIDKTPIRELFEKPVDDRPEICENVGFQLSLNF